MMALTNEYPELEDIEQSKRKLLILYLWGWGGANKELSRSSWEEKIQVTF